MKKAFLFAVLLLVVYGSCAQLAFSYEQVVYGNNLTMPYRKALIAQDNEELSSLVIYLHGGSSRGNDNELQLQEPGTDSIANYLVRKNKKSIFVVPQCPLRKSWVPNMSNAVVAMINSLLSSGLVDPDRVYIFGGSMGGTGTWGMVSANPNMFAAAMPVAGNPSHSNAESVSHTPIYTVMGTADNIMSIPTVQEFLQELEAYGGEYRFDIEEGWTHAQTCIESYTEVRLDWVFSHPADSIYCEITGYGDNNGDWHLIASPLAESIAPTEVGNLVAENAADFDLYRFNQAADLEWENYKTEGFDLEPGKGYLYANKEDVTLIFTGVPYNGTGEVTLSKTTGVNFEGWNLVGNPFNEMAYIVDGRFFYTMNAENTEIIASTSNSIEAMEGIFVIANEDEETMTFTTTEPQNGNGKGLVINLSKGASTPSTGSGTGSAIRGGVIDRAIVRFGEGQMLPKFQIKNNSTKLYIPHGNKDYAVVSTDNQGEMPVNFKAEENGTYMLSFSIEDIEIGYLHLIDNMTGTDIDLLSTQTYSFEARTTDYASRFKLLFSANDTESTFKGSETFAFFSNGNWIINNEGKALLQIVDFTGRILSSEAIDHSCSKNLNVSAGVYMLRLINNESVKTQKIVIKY